jgi:hypothetical protein
VEEVLAASGKDEGKGEGRFLPTVATVAGACVRSPPPLRRRW